MVVNIFLFDDFEIMDAFGPAQIFGSRPDEFYVRYLSLRGGLLLESRELKSGQNL